MQDVKTWLVIMIMMDKLTNKVLQMTIMKDSTDVSEYLSGESGTEKDMIKEDD